MKKILAVVLCLILAGSALVAFSACGKKDESGTQPAAVPFKAGVWAVIENGEETGKTYTFTDSMTECSFDNGITAIPFDYQIEGQDYIFHMGSADDNSSANVIFTDEENASIAWADTGVTDIVKYVGEGEGKGEAPSDVRRMIINSEPVVITAKDGFDNAGVTELLCDAPATYSFTASDEDTTWKVFVLDERFEDGARYLSQAKQPALEGNGTLTIDADKYIYILCSESVFTADAASDATLTIDYADEEDVTPDKLFSKGVWSASVDGKIDTYFIFDDEANGRTERADGTGGVPFTCEQNGLDVVFHFGSADDVTNAKFSTGDNTGTFEYADKTVVYTFEAVSGADPATFEVPAAE